VDYRVFPLGSDGQRENQEAKWISFIRTFLFKNEGGQERVSVSIPRETTLVRFLRLPLAAKENLAKVLEYEAPKLTPFDKDEFYSDFQVLKEDSQWIYLIAVFVRKEDLAPYLNLLKKMGLQPISIQIPAISALNLFFYHEGQKKNEVSVLLDVNDPNFEMNILEGADWKDSFHLPLPREEKEEGVLRAFKRCELNDPSLSRGMFFVYGMDAIEDRLPHFHEAHGMKGVASPPMDRIEVGPDETLPDYIYSSVGLPLTGLMQTPFRLNLLPPEMRKKIPQYGKKASLILLCLAIILGLTWGGGIYSRYRNELEVLRAEVRKKKPEVDVVEKLQKQRAKGAAEIAEFDKITRGAVSEVQVLRELTQILPSSVWVWQYRFTGKEIEISGFADSASELIPLLDKSSIFERVEFMAPVTKERERRLGADKERERFKIKMRIEGVGGTP
jgi:Tfp pilus assembly protein PilN